MSEEYFYRAKTELAEDLWDFKDQYATFVKTVIKPFSDEWPDNQPVKSAFGNIIGFADGKSKQDPPEGLSRSVKRDYLIPARGRKGDRWNDLLERFNAIPKLSTVLEGHDIPDHVIDGNRMCFVRWMDFGREDGAFLILSTSFDPVPAAVEAVKRSEFYALHERAMEEKSAIAHG